jgi:hypothetical protein
MGKCTYCNNNISKWGVDFCSSKCAATYNNKRRVNKKIEENRLLIEQMMDSSETIQYIRQTIGISTDTFKREYPDYKGNQGYSRKKQTHIKRKKAGKRQSIFEHIEQHGTTGLDTGWSNQKGWIKKYLIKRDGPACSQCGWAGVNPTSGNVMTELDHIDGDKTNNHVDNCRVLCPNCHSLTPTFRNITRNTLLQV